MNIPVLTQLVSLIEEIFKAHGSAVAQAAETAAAQAAIGTVEQDPKVEAITAASIALLTAAQNVKEALNTPSAVPIPTDVHVPVTPPVAS